MGLPIRRGGGALSRGAMWDPIRDFESMWDEMGRMLERAATPAGGGTWMPMAEEREDDNAYTVKVELPGFPPENIDLEVEGDELVISGELAEEHSGKVLSRRTGKFMYRTTLPPGADSEQCDAKLDNGILTVTVPKREQRAERRKIEIGTRRTIAGETEPTRMDPQAGGE
ncbi:Hsp20/alpha crystallin family protein [Streptomyces sp. NPDC015346]|uniref:Hsp20/alpha crystallin family protein n=1 Tax=Streptomyces sp. NPDC015346 TaxID=3364954 RepID=UPI0037009D52